jgi:hypothetical protein
VPAEGATAVTATAPVAASSGPTRAQRRASAGTKGGGGGGRRWGLILGIIVLALVVAGVGAAVAGGVFSGGSSGPSAPKASTNVDLKVGKVSTEWPGDGPASSDSNLPDEALAVIGKYIDNGVVPGLRTGKVQTASLSGIFDQNALSQLDGDARPAVLDENLPQAVGEIKIISKPVSVAVLNDGDNKTLFVTTRIHLDVQVDSDKGKYTVTRKGDMVLAPDPSGKLKVTAWDLKTFTTPPGQPKVTTTTTTTTLGKKKTK